MTVFPFPPSVYSSEYLKRDPLRSVKNAHHTNRQLNKSLEKMLIHPQVVYSINQGIQELLQFIINYIMCLGFPADFTLYKANMSMKC